MTLAEELVAAVEGLLDVAELAMPDSYFDSDSRVRKAKAALARAAAEKGLGRNTS